ncbi:energy-coupling factor transporter transmembrane component T family protein [Desulfotomaculum copahuensis]|uniref:Cobalt transporter n=1 Tax=Desulfotomaculum copahuensis TaxID=1838280 RepID=A0A1B7LE26_9FIRM|nr:energy-coupling factor transporter transmembrane component T [Desulfotomaculum copahuensis]OAT81314.1 cobalt transporter [Desulfotomaculum copahuensis]
MLDSFFYKEKGLFLQNLHPLAALVYLGTLLSLALLFTNPLYLAGLLCLVFLAVWSVDGLPAWEGYLKMGLTMMVLVMLVNPLMVRAGETIIWYGPRVPVLGRLNISLEAVYYGAAMSVRLLDVISVFCLYNLMVHPDKALNLFSRLAWRSTMVISLATRMFPSMVRELANIREVQQMRGVNFQQGKFGEKVKKHASLINILLLSSLEDSLEIAESMQARAFGSGPRTCYSRSLFRPRDALCLAGSALALGAGIWGLLHGFGVYTYYPRLGYLLQGPGTVLVLAAVLLGLSIPVVLSWGWRHWPYLKSKI